MFPVSIILVNTSYLMAKVPTPLNGNMAPLCEAYCETEWSGEGKETGKVGLEVPGFSDLVAKNR